MSKMKFEIVHFLVNLVLLLLNIRGCGGQPLHSKSILKVVSQMVRLHEYANVFFLIYKFVFLHFKTIYICYTKAEHPVIGNYFVNVFTVYMWLSRYSKIIVWGCLLLQMPRIWGGKVFFKGDHSSLWAGLNMVERTKLQSVHFLRPFCT